MVAVQGDPRPTKVLYLATLADEADLSHPTAALDQRPGILQLAWAVWKDLANRKIWVATSGKAGIKLNSLEGPCPKVAGWATVQCTAGKFGVMLDGQFQPLVDGQRSQIDRSASLAIATRAEVNGAVLTFSTP